MLDAAAALRKDLVAIGIRAILSVANMQEA